MPCVALLGASAADITPEKSSRVDAFGSDLRALALPHSAMASSDEASENDSSDADFEPSVWSCIQYTCGLLGLQRKGLEPAVVDLIGIYLRVFQRDGVWSFVQYNNKTLQFSSIQGHSGYSQNWTVGLGWQVPFAGTGSTLLDGSQPQQPFGDLTVDMFFECKHPIFPDVFEKMDEEAPSEDSGSRDSQAYFVNFPGGVLVRRSEQNSPKQVENQPDQHGIEGGEEEDLENDVEVHSDLPHNLDPDHAGFEMARRAIDESEGPHSDRSALSRLRRALDEAEERSVRSRLF